MRKKSNLSHYQTFSIKLSTWLLNYSCAVIFLCVCLRSVATDLAFLLHHHRLCTHKHTTLVFCFYTFFPSSISIYSKASFIHFFFSSLETMFLLFLFSSFFIFFSYCIGMCFFSQFTIKFRLCCVCVCVCVHILPQIYQQLIIFYRRPI